MSEYDIRLIATDLDGTFLGEKSRLIPQNGSAFQLAHNQGIQTAIASGRLAAVGRGMALALGLESCHIIGLNGAQIYPVPFGENARETAFPDTLRDACFDVISYYGCLYNVYTSRAIYTNQRMTAEREAQFRSSFINGGVEAHISSDAFERSVHQPCLKLLFKPGGDEAAYQKARKEISALGGVYIMASGAGVSEIMPAGISKASALRALVQGLGIRMDQVMCFGDYDNDAEMLAACGVSVAMGNASPAAREAAKYITADHREAGVALAVSALLDGTLERFRK